MRIFPARWWEVPEVRLTTWGALLNGAWEFSMVVERGNVRADR